MAEGRAERYRSDQRHPQCFFRAAGDAEEAHTMASRSPQMGEEGYYDGPKVAEIATKLGLIVVAR